MAKAKRYRALVGINFVGESGKERRVEAGEIVDDLEQHVNERTVANWRNNDIVEEYKGRKETPRSDADPEALQETVVGQQREAK